MQLFNRVVVSTLVAGLFAGLVTATLQQLSTTPLIIEAEKYEGNGHEHEHEDEHRAEEEANGWAPAEGFERMFYTSITTIATAFGFALILLVGMILAKEAISVRTGLAWGAAAFVATGLAPAFGLSPELPGSATGELGSRQMWWVGTIFATAVGLWLVLKVSSLIAVVMGLVLIIAPHVIGAPHPVEFTSEVPGELTAHFVSTSLAVHAVMWSLIGAIIGYMWSRGEASSNDFST